MPNARQLTTGTSARWLGNTTTLSWFGLQAFDNVTKSGRMRNVRTYTCSYHHGGREHVVHIDAEDDLDASHRLRAIGTTAKVDGILVADMPIERHEGWLTKLRLMISGETRR